MQDLLTDMKARMGFADQCFSQLTTNAKKNYLIGYLKLDAPGSCSKIVYIRLKINPHRI